MENQLEQLSYAQSAIIGLVLAAFYYFFIYSVTNYDSVIKEFEGEISQTNIEITNIDALIREKRELDAELLKNEDLVKRSEDIIMGEVDRDVALETLTNKARSYGLSIESMGSLSEWALDKQFARAEVNFVLNGTYAQMMFFFI